MKKSALWKDIWVEIRSSLPRFLSVVGLIFLGTSFFVGFKAFAPDLIGTASTYYQDYQLMDFRVLSDYGIEDEDVQILEEDKDLIVDPIQYVDVLMEGDERPLRFYTLGDKTRSNQFMVTEGRLPEKPGEITLDNRMLYFGLKIGDEFKIIKPESTSNSEDFKPPSLKDDTYTIVGFAQNPMYVEITSRDYSAVGSGQLIAFAVVDPAEITGDIYNEVWIRDKTAPVNDYSDAYEEFSKEKKAAIEAQFAARPESRLKAIRVEAMQKLTDAEKKVADGKQELADAQQKLIDGENEIIRGNAALTEEEVAFENTIQTAQKRLNDAYALLVSGQADYDSGLKAYQSGLAQYEDGKVLYATEKAKAETELAQAQKQLNTFKESVPEVTNGLVQEKAAKDNVLAMPDSEIKTALLALLSGTGSKGQVQKAIQNSYAELATAETTTQATLTDMQAKEIELLAGTQQLETGITGIEQQLAANHLRISKEQELAFVQATAQSHADQLSLLKAEANPDQAAIDAITITINEAQTQAATLTAEILALPNLSEEEVTQVTAQKQALIDQRAPLLVQQEQLKAGIEASQTGLQTISQKQAELKAEESRLTAMLNTPSLVSQLTTKLGTASQTEAGQLLIGYASGTRTLADVNNYITQAEGQIASGRSQLSAGQKTLDQSKAQLDAAYQSLTSGKRELDQGWADFTAGRNDLEAGRQEGLTQLNEAKQKLADARIELAKGQTEFAEEKAKADVEIADAEKEIKEGYADLEGLKLPEYYVNEIAAYKGYAGLRDNAERIEAIAGIFPIFFFLIASLVSWSTMKRMVDNQRTHMGTLKALGYSDFDINKKFLVYAGLESVIGAVFGITLGYRIFPSVIYMAYNTLYRIPPFQLNTYLPFTLAAVAIALACTLLPTILTTNKALKSVPANLMRPLPPKSGQRILLERWSWFWDKLSFNYKITFRNLFRYKGRNSMTIIGVAGCVALILVGLGLRDTIGSLATVQFEEIEKFSGMIFYKDDITSSDYQQIQDDLLQNDAIEAITIVGDYDYETTDTRIVTQSVSVFVPLEEGFTNFVTLRDRKSQETLPLDDSGVIVTEKLANLLHIQPGDTITLRDKDLNEVTFLVAGISEYYLLHSVYVSKELYEKTIGKQAEQNAFLFNSTYDTREKEDRFIKQMMDRHSGITRILFMNVIADELNTIIDTLNVITYLLVVSAAALAFIVLFNLLTINVSERIRELSTIKVLGFYDREVSNYIFRETWILVIIGNIIGFGLGYWLLDFLMKAVEVDNMLFPAKIYWPSYLLSFVLTCLFASFVMYMMHRKLKNVDMLEALKSVD